jgi:protein-L-isoaspartate(D-aspartate) O-methyltransferase
LSFADDFVPAPLLARLSNRRREFVEAVQKYQNQLLAQARQAWHQTPLRTATEKAFLETPRHAFVSRYREWGTKEWHEISADNLIEHLARIYATNVLILVGDDDADIRATISEPMFALGMLNMLQLERGQRVFELGAGSGWNAAMMGHLVGPSGHVYSVEIIPELARQAAKNIEAQGIKTVTIIEGDGGDGYAPGAPYDCAIFTAGTFDLPRYFYQQIKEDGLLLVVIKTEGGGDTLFILKKRADHFESIDSMQCGFVQMRGKHHMDSLEPVDLETLPEWASLQSQEQSSTPFWWGGKGVSSFAFRTQGIRSFLGVTEPLFRAFKTGKTKGKPYEEHYFGLWDKPGGSLVIARDDRLVAYGSLAAKERLVQDIEEWFHLGMSTPANFKLQVYPLDARLAAGTKQWLVKRSESQFLWSLDQDQRANTALEPTTAAP